MGIMLIKKVSASRISAKSNAFLPIFGLATVIFATDSYAFTWNAVPTLQFQEIFSDNVALAPKGGEQAAFVSELSPGLSLSGQSPRTQFNLNYRMQNLYNSGGDDSVRIANQLQQSSDTTFAKNLFFLNSSSSISQQNLSSTRLANDNINGFNNSTTVNTFSLTPILTPHFGHFANANIRANFNTVTTDSQSTAVNAISDTITLQQTAQLNSGTDFKRVSWGLNFSNNESLRSGAEDVKFQNADGIVRLALSQNFSVFAQGGFSDNSFQSLTNNSRNGAFYTAGVRWTPSQRYSIEAGYGNNSFITVNLTPIQRFSLSGTFRNRDIGLNTGNTFQVDMNYRTRQSIWSITHDNDTTTSQAILLQQRIFNLVDPFGNAITNPVTSQPVQFAINLPTLTNEVITRKRWNFSVSYQTGKSTITANAYNEDRVFQITRRNEEVRGLGASWNWQFESKTSAFIAPNWQQSDNAASLIDATTSDFTRFDVAVGINRTINTWANGRLEFRHLDQSSDDTANGFTENRATATVNMRF